MPAIITGWQVPRGERSFLAVGRAWFRQLLSATRLDYKRRVANARRVELDAHGADFARGLVEDVNLV